MSHEWNDPKTKPGKERSDWVVLARSSQDLGSLAHDKEHWLPARVDPKIGIWTDDFSNVLGVFLGN